MRLTKLVGVTACWLPVVAAQAADPLDAVADAVVKQINEQQQDIAALYDASLLRQVSAAKLLEVFKSLHDEYGLIIGVTPESRQSDENGVFTLTFKKGTEIPLTLVITKQKPARISGILFGAPVAPAKDIESILKELEKLPGRVNFQLARLGKEIEVIEALHENASLAIGSTFKLYLLGTVIELGKPWEKVLKLKKKRTSLPTGILQNWPEGSPVTLHTLAVQMISISDNTAADHLLRFLRRKNVEKQLAIMGHAHPEQSWPMLTTLEMFALKSDPALLADYVKVNRKRRREILKNRVRKIPLEDIEPFPDGTPVAIDTVEWFASAADLCRAMDWFRRKGNRQALDILALNPGVEQMKSQFAYMGFKGGSEPGVLNLTWLLTTKKGSHYALSIGWNNPADEGVDLLKLLGYARSTLRLIAER